jgi:ATP-binding cassette subfamily B protein
LAYVFSLLRLLDRRARRWTAAWAAILLVQGILPLPVLHFTRVLVDRLVLALNTGPTLEAYQPVLVATAGLASLLVLSELLQSSAEWVRAIQVELVQEQLTSLVHQQSVTVDLSFYESADFHDSLDRARGDSVSRSIGLLESLGSALQNGIALAAMTAALIPYGVWLPTLLLATALPAMLAVLITSRQHHIWWKRSTTDRRRASYYDYLLTSQYSAAEMRLFNLGPHFRTLWQQLRTRLRLERMSLLRQQGLYRFAAAFLGMVISAAAFGWVLWSAARGQVTLGDIALMYQVFGRAQANLRSLLSSVAQLYSNSLFAENLFDFLALKPRILSPPKPRPAPERLSPGVRFQRVTFRYPGQQEAALNRFDLEIRAGQFVAVVGENGAGKSTLVKLLCRFYDPEEGSVQIDGADLREFSLAELRKRITVLFQLPVAYQVTARHSVRLGDTDLDPEESPHWDSLVTARLDGSLRAALADRVISHLPLGLDTPLGKWFAGGVELSAGEWQRLSMARTLFRRSEIVILDEPTSFLDAWSEAEWFDAVRAFCKDRTVILITHRLSIARRADCIHVVHKGRVAEFGSHEELLARDGRYAESWQIQQKLARYETSDGLVR